MHVFTLIDRAKSETGSDAATARALGVHPPKVSDWRHGRVPCPATVQDKLCILACLNDAEIAAHVAERAGMKRKPRTTFITASVAAFAGSLATAIALFVAPDTNRTALKPVHPNV